VAEPLFREALGVRRETLGARHSDTLAATYNLAAVLQVQGNVDEAELLYYEVLEGMWAGPEPPTPAYPRLPRFSQGEPRFHLSRSSHSISSDAQQAVADQARSELYEQSGQPALHERQA
jgi:hypothetical protein